MDSEKVIYIDKPDSRITMLVCPFKPKPKTCYGCLLFPCVLYRNEIARQVERDAL